MPGNQTPRGRKGKKQPQTACGFESETQVAHEPKQHATQVFLRAQREKQCRRSTEPGCQYDTGQQQACRRPTTRSVSDRKYEQRRGQRTAEGSEIDNQAAKAEHHREQCSDGGTAGGAQNIGLGERVTQ